jgi:hypothetical protein
MKADTDARPTETTPDRPLSVRSDDWFCAECNTRLSLIDTGDKCWRWSAHCPTCRVGTRAYIDPETALSKLGAQNNDSAT